MAVTGQIAFALQLLIEIIGIDRIAARKTRIDNPDARTIKIKTSRFCGFCDAFLTANKNGRAKPLINVGNSGTHHLFFFAFGKDDAFWLAAHALINAAQC
ncbi:hypothetical protein D9M69_594630 [compost metagenome]